MTDLKLTFLGGASAIGASSILVEVAGATLLVDCGVRFRSSSPLPDLSALAGKDLDAVLVTHAHSDHTGGLAVVHEAFPNALIYATPPTADLVRILQRDALRIMDSAAEHEGDIPLYNERQVEAMVQALSPIHHLEKRTIKDIEVTFLPASHILGASMIHLATPAGNVLITGDYSVSAQATVPALDRPLLPVDLVVTETTYGDRLHADRGAAENRLIDQVRMVTESGGRVLIPAFAIGRAQEVLQILKKALRAGRLPSVPVYVDGMVKSVCDVYSRHERYGSALLAREIRAGRHPFYDQWIRPVARPADRRDVLAGGACVIVASSGMLSGGASAFYAREIAGCERDAILITGYQDEESPGRALLRLAEQGGRGSLRLPDGAVDVRCHFDSYGLSAHADRSQMAALLGALKPKTVVLVHGNQAAKAGLAKTLSIRDVEHAEDGTVLTRRYQPRSRALGALPETDARPFGLAALLEVLGTFPLDEPLPSTRLATAWYQRSIKPHETAALVDAIERLNLVRRDDHKRHLLRILPSTRALILEDEALEAELRSENPKGKLLEWCARKHIEPPKKLETTQNGKAVVELQLSVGAELLCSGLQHAGTSKIAEQLAARELLRKLLGADAASAADVHQVTDAEEADLKASNPKGRLLEHCAEGSLAPPEFDVQPVAGGFRARVLVVSISVPCPWHAASRARAAEQAAAAWALANLPAAAAPSQPTTSAPEPTDIDPRLALNELTQKGLLARFGYDPAVQTGPPHAPRFVARAWAEGPGGSREVGEAGTAATKKDAQREAARLLVAHLAELSWIPRSTRQVTETP